MRNRGVAEIAREMGCSKAYVSMVMSGRKKPSERLAAKLAELTRLTTELTNPAEGEQNCGSLRHQENPAARGGTCRGRGSNPHRPRGLTDFKSVASANSATSALLHWKSRAATFPALTEPGCASAPLYYATSNR